MGIYNFNHKSVYDQINYVSKEYILNYLNIKLFDLDGDFLDISNQDYYMLLEYN